jgi:hypothetical protein
LVAGGSPCLSLAFEPNSTNPSGEKILSFSRLQAVDISTSESSPERRDLTSASVASRSDRRGQTPDGSLSTLAYPWIMIEGLNQKNIQLDADAFVVHNFDHGLSSSDRVPCNLKMGSSG